MIILLVSAVFNVNGDWVAWHAHACGNVEIPIFNGFVGLTEGNGGGIAFRFD